MSKYTGFIGPTYLLTSVTVAAERCLNLYPESVEVPWEKGRLWLTTTPGLINYCLFPTGSCRGAFAQDGRGWFVAGDHLYEINSDGSFIDRGAVAADGNPASMASNGQGGHQLLVLSGGHGYIFDLIANTLNPIVATGFPTSPLVAGFIDGYFVVLDAIANTMHLSGLFDGTSWSGLDVAQRSTASDNLVSMVMDHREIWLFGSKTGEAWYDSGAADFPFAPIPGSFVPQGSASAFGAQTFDNSIAWISQSVDGGGMVLKAQGYMPTRISNHALEEAMATYPKISDAEGFVYQVNGHVFYVLYFPSANVTWVYDASTGMWHERSWYNASANTQDAHRARCHMYVFGLHLVGDRQTGQVYIWSNTTYSDAGVAIHRIRQAPHICQEKDWVFHKAFELDAEYGLGIQSGQGSNPQIALSWSNDGGHTFSNEYWQTMGAQGNYQQRAQWRRLGRARDRVYKVRMTDPSPLRLNEAYLELQMGLS